MTVMKTRRSIAEYLILPREVTPFEAAYRERWNRVGFLFFCAHVPVMAFVALLSNTSVLRAILYTAALLIGPAIAMKTFDNPRRVSMVLGFVAMCMGGLLVHFGQGPMQIEMHFYFFVLIALLVVFADPLVIIAAAVTVAAHHATLYFLMPDSVFNYDATIWAVVVHAIFVVLESLAAIFVARSFFDSVTQEVKRAHDGMKLVLDHVDQGFLTADPSGRIGDHRSAVLEAWLGPIEDGDTIWSYLARADQAAGKWLEAGWEAVFDGFLPEELALDQLPARAAHGGRLLSLSYRVIDVAGEGKRLLCILTDATSRILHERSEAARRELSAIAEGIVKDEEGFVDFVSDTKLVTDALGAASSAEEERRLLHTVKGNVLGFGLEDLGKRCHDLETLLDDERRRLTESEKRDLAERVDSVSTRVRRLTGDGARKLIQLEAAEHAALLSALERGASRDALRDMLNELRLEPVAARLHRIGDRARSIATRMGRSNVEVKIESNVFRLDEADWAPLWPAFVHVIKNALAHGLEPAEDRERTSKPVRGTLRLTADADDETYRIAVEDDGRGIDWDAVAAKAEAVGLPFTRREDLVAALFADGLSTAASTDEHRGRGVGMSAFADACHALGGHVEVESTSGVGTRVVARIPRRSALRASTSRVAA